MPLSFEWDERKARANLSKHGVTFEEAATIFGDVLSLTIADPAHSGTEDRFVILGNSYRQRLLVVVFVERRDTIRIVSARRATKTERKSYEESQ
jgi:uncharacterized DUF497 family protein